jgi:hypothetical protein
VINEELNDLIIMLAVLAAVAGAVMLAVGIRRHRKDRRKG